MNKILSLIILITMSTLIFGQNPIPKTAFKVVGNEIKQEKAVISTPKTKTVNGQQWTYNEKDNSWFRYIQSPVTQSVTSSDAALGYQSVVVSTPKTKMVNGQQWTHNENDNTWFRYVQSPITQSVYEPWNLQQAAPVYSQPIRPIRDFFTQPQSSCPNGQCPNVRRR